MKKVIRLTESDLIKIVNKVLNEQQVAKDCFKGVTFNVPPVCMNSSDMTSGMACLKELTDLERESNDEFGASSLRKPEVRSQIASAVRCVKSRVTGRTI